MLQLEIRDDILLLRLNEPRKLNAWSQAVREEVRLALASADANPAIRAVVITGAGDRSFCAGADLADPTMGVPEAAQGRMDAFRAMYYGIQSFRKPLVAALNGFAFGSAFQAILLMDYRVGHPGVTVGLPEINSGMPCITGSAILSWSVGPMMARTIATTGRPIGAEEAVRHGLIEEIVPPEQVLDRAMDVARELAGKSPEAFAETKLWLRDLTLPALDAAFARAAEVRGKENVAHSVRAGIGDFFGQDKPTRA
ncbi:enoyl-CoA hydratase/isomerase family protein [Oceanibaculum pacificum]|uniref:Enoyl-CoA hydratase n=1 Tax=Oceanibaculum pacificum TaxID=580166 RepID=A0A154W4Z5_9PROT|nr:enoyl-CoA hydratase/isomerase family protein [Oceanibaculum pacificum]KZD08543.1 hypothetical protein AUP43_08400 [Oceanibaculum pacificum]